VQRVIDDWASAGERLQLAFSWTDPLATSVLLVVMLLLALGLWVVGLQVLVTVGLLWVFRWVLCVERWPAGNASYSPGTLPNMIPTAHHCEGGCAGTSRCSALCLPAQLTD
jgi:hypothetical protein